MALTWWGNPFGAPPSADAVKSGAAAVGRAIAAPAPTQRETAYIDAARALFEDAATVGPQRRAFLYRQRMQQVHERFPDDSEATVFYALSLAFTSDPTDRSRADRLAAAALLTKVFAAQPDHPGAAHYLIHVYDTPDLAAQGLEFAKVYSGIAPAVPHALHMPSHTFTQLGLWRDAIESNRASVAAATGMDLAHALDFLTYAYLQTAQDDAAQKAAVRIAEMQAVDPALQLQQPFAFAFAAIPARIALERGRWHDASVLTSGAAGSAWLPQAEAVTHLAKGVGAARGGDIAAARSELVRLRSIREAIVTRDAYWSDQVESWARAVEGWIARVERRDDDAERALRSAAELEERADKAPVWPAQVAPSREMLAELLLEIGRPAEAIAEFEATLAREPNRLRSLAGAANAAQAAGDQAKALRFYRQVVVQADIASTRAEVTRARDVLAGR